jgi:hypothetical protein
MAYAPDVLKQSIHDARLLVAAPSLGDADDLRSLLSLAQSALAAGAGEIPDSEVRNSGLHPATLELLGVSTLVDASPVGVAR